MSYTLYISDHCSSCEQAIRFLEKNNVNYRTINLATDFERPNNVLIVPALLKDGKLIAFGPDIPSYLSKMG